MEKVEIKNLKALTPEAIVEIDAILSAGYDVEARKNQYGVTVASVSKQVRYKGGDNGKSAKV